LREALGRNYLAPISSPGRVLDVGTGTGQWGFEVCWEHPEALVVGLDLIPGRAEHPSGYRHVRGNVLLGLPFREGVFDFVHQRFLMSGVPVPMWPGVVGELARVTRPGGWVELVEPRVSPEYLGPAGRRQFGLLLELAGSRGLDTADVVFGSLDGYLRRAGLEAVERREVELPIGEWGGRVGSFMLSDIRAVCTRLCEVLESRGAISAEEAADLIRRSTREFEEYRTVWPVAVAFGRRSR
ncbi:MAG TPA: class I SAM-dependent methyltransferase, partial [Candidatus Dormibacteraeota bacterium]|nr:class I SAM-dependent methyltransferase [Candidatus Dormibacteraeota bacterium]